MFFFCFASISMLTSNCNNKFFRVVLTSTVGLQLDSVRWFDEVQWNILLFSRNLLKFDKRLGYCILERYQNSRTFQNNWRSENFLWAWRVGKIFYVEFENKERPLECVSFCLIVISSQNTPLLRLCIVFKIIKQGLKGCIYQIDTLLNQ